MQLAGNNISRYEQLFQPQENALVQDANTYASTPRIQMAMGAAESATGQAANAGRINAEDTLRSYGIDPSSGRYQELETAQRAGAAAAQAGAGQQAELATEATGRQLRQQAIQVGQQYPGQAVNALNAGLQGIAGAENAALGRANTGVNLTQSAAPYFNAAMGLKYPPVGNTSSSQQSSQSSPDQSSGGGQGGGYRSGGGGGGSGGGGGGGFGSSPSFDNSGSGAPLGSSPDTSYQDPGQFYDPYGAFGQNTNSTTQDVGSQFYDPYSAGSFAGSSDTQAAGQSDIGGGSMPDLNTYMGDSSGGYARGGGVLPGPDATTGGHVPLQASPSMGHTTDDIPARLNAEEFVIPRDVARWKGQEFFQNLIEESRRKRMGAPAKGKSKPALGGQPRFMSQHLPQRPMLQNQMGAQ